MREASQLIDVTCELIGGEAARPLKAAAGRSLTAATWGASAFSELS